MKYREKTLIRETLELLRKTLRKSPDFRNSDWRDVDDWLFAELPFTKEELREIYADSGIFYDGSSAASAEDFRLSPYLGCPLRCARTSSPDNEYGAGAEVYAMAEGMPTVFTSQQLPIISRYIGQTPRLEKHQWTGSISLWFGSEKIWDSRADAYQASAAS